ncbi:glycosyltransferase [Actinomadura kijaniata]|uniref:Glycosyltransferase involved in cell wall biosynthesis n=1 Tax=Actinomadura namibiensis TaxID=182080 RepID=A0A7W3QPJ0_ACTNM|nr:glycosyltransferase family 4 protein [Actinomadura namibiensis]MBA8954674.1 glycosyltransferase involved in cell wall biosynthesis [Actinomadura namibiensis]
MRIAIVGPAFPYKGGGAQHTTELAHRLAAAGHTVRIETWRAQYPGFLYPGRQTIEEPEGEPFPNTGRDLDWRRPDGWFRVGRALRSADLVVLSVLSPVQVPSYLGILTGIGGKARTVALCHNVLPHERKPYDVPLMKKLLGRVDGVLVHSAQQADLARGLTARPIRTAEMPAHLPRADSLLARTPAVSRAEHVEGARRPERSEDGHHREPGGVGGRPPTRKRLLFFGIVRPYKGLDILLRALAKGPEDVSLTVAGEFWGGLDETRALIGELGLNARVDLRPGYVPASEMPALFASADALVLPYRTATASQNVWIAHEHGLPVIATTVGGFPDQVRDGVDGLLVGPEDVSSLADAIRRFYAPGEPERLRSQVRPVDHGPLWDAYVAELTSS